MRNGQMMLPIGDKLKTKTNCQLSGLAVAFCGLAGKQLREGVRSWATYGNHDIYRLL